MKKLLYKISVFLVIPFLLTGCLEEFKDLRKIQNYTWNPELSLPVANSTFGLTEFLENDSIDDYVSTDENGLIIFTYQDQFSSENAQSYFEIPDESYSETFSFDAPLLLQLPVQGEISQTETFENEVTTEEGDEIDSVFLRINPI